ncbi:hypothetical protein Bca52824_023929 [Brassica carinata]|uniref:Ubiquitin-like protease family profile domain-containing protein n=1 Tax=Brassica carinata TaxID=52824 RepID=A0A8X8AW84_BRACI|nr:hypothetical protein Bca52824_023929 [Brassica carinata]
MSKSEKLDKLIQMVHDLGKRVEVIQNVLGVKVPDGSSNKQDYENVANYDDTKNAPDDENEEEAISGDKRNVICDENDEEICDEEAISDTQQLTEVTSSTPTFTTPKFDTRVTSPTPIFITPKCDLLSQESRHSGKGANEHIEADNKKSFQFGSGFDKSNIEKNINFLYSAIAVEEKYWLGIVVSLEKRNIAAFNCAALKYTDASVGAYVNAYAVVLPFMIHNIFKDVNMNPSKFALNVVYEGFPHVLKLEDSGVYALKLIECHAMQC